MPANPRHRTLTLDDYFEIELASAVRHEFVDGLVLAMAGGSVAHNDVAANVLTVLRTTLRGGPCRALGSDQRLATADGLYTYPDVAVYCGEIALIPGRPDTATNPVVVVEVLSDATRAYDRGEKLERYRSIPTLAHVLLIEPERVDVEHWYRADPGWARCVATSVDDEVRLDAIGRTFVVRELYGDPPRTRPATP